MAETAGGGSGGRRRGRFPRLGGASWSFTVAWEQAERRHGASLLAGRWPGSPRTRWLVIQEAGA